ncbi:DUF5688 family protein [Enterocloster clostridioformis]|uniref:DUF5688 family protein n=1 Tax=Enterocloster clostridioformis TaxID=1531 RepID=UPI0022DF1478|nr:DUF5688 family protein [Enterocloster clostridioformis]
MDDDKKQFYKEFLAEMKKAMESTDIHVSGDDLNSGTEIPGINFHLNDNVIIPSIYPEVLFIEYKHGIPVEDIVKAEKSMILEKIAQVSNFDVHNADPEEVAGKIRAAVVNYDSGKDWLKNMPHEKMLDVAVYAKIDFGAGYGIKVDDRMLADLHLTKEELFKTAKENVLHGRELIKVEEIALEYICEHGIGEDEIQDMVALVKMPSYVFDYRNRVEPDGAVIVSSPGVLKQIHEQLGSDFYILPCSVEQVLIVPKSACKTELKDLEKFVAEMSRREIPLQDQLSAQVYEFDGTALRMAGENLTIEKDGLVNITTHHRSR